MPEHRAGTPAGLRILESFLWHDLDARSWPGWAARVLPDARDAGHDADAALRLHAALRSMQAVNAGPVAGPAPGPTTGAAGAAEALNRLVRQRAVVPVVAPDGTAGLGAARADDAVSVLLLDALQAMRTGSWRRFRLCADPACRTSFFDGGRSGTGRWCSMAGCGSRDKMRRFRSRNAAAAGSGPGKS